MPPSTIPSTSSAISSPGRRFGSSDQKRRRNGAARPTPHDDSSRLRILTKTPQLDSASEGTEGDSADDPAVGVAASDRQIPGGSGADVPTVYPRLDQLHSHFYKSELTPTLHRIDAFLIRWARNKFERLRQWPKGVDRAHFAEPSGGRPEPRSQRRARSPRRQATAGQARVLRPEVSPRRCERLRVRLTAIR
jgi:hypothetical protein